MNSIKITPRKVEGQIEHEGIEFSHCTFIDIYVDGVRLDLTDSFEGVAYWPELRKSADGSGTYLVFTCYCGVADDAGWEPIVVKHKDQCVTWSFKRNGPRKYLFGASEYISAISQCEKALELNQYPLAVESAVWPE
jgi:hypothetical protein